MNTQAGLTRVVHEVRELELADGTTYEDGRLAVGEQAVRDLLRDPALAEVRLACASPGDSGAAGPDMSMTASCARGR